MRVALMLLLAVPIGAGPPSEQDPATTPAVAAVLRCRPIAELVQRAACYDAAAATLADAVKQRSIVVLDREDVKQTKRSLFGFSLPKLPIFAGRAGEESDKTEDIREITSRILSLRDLGYGMWSIGLAEGGVWRTTEARREFFPKLGQEITIKRGALGNYLATMKNQPTLRVARTG